MSVLSMETHNHLHCHCIANYPSLPWRCVTGALNTHSPASHVAGRWLRDLEAEEGGLTSCAEPSRGLPTAPGSEFCWVLLLIPKQRP